MRRAWLVLMAALLLPASACANVARWGAYSGGLNKVAGPTLIEGLEQPVAVRASNDSNYVLEADGAVEAFGLNGRGELGDGTEENSFTTPVRMDYPAGVDIVAIGQGEDAYYAIDSTGQLWSGGESPCSRQNQFSLTPTEVPGVTSALEAEGGGHHVLILLANGTVEVCGNGEYGQLGLGYTVENVRSPTPVPGLENVVEVQAGDLSSCVRTASGEVYDFGEDTHGQMGNGVEKQGVYTPYHVPLPGPASSVYCGGDLPTDGTSLAVVEGVVYGWGDDKQGEVGDGAKVNKPSPTRTGIHAASVATGGNDSLGLTAGGELLLWGSNVGAPENVNLTPMLVQTGVTQISATARDLLSLH